MVRLLIGQSFPVQMWVSWVGGGGGGGELWRWLGSRAGWGASGGVGEAVAWAGYGRAARGGEGGGMFCVDEAKWPPAMIEGVWDGGY